MPGITDRHRDRLAGPRHPLPSPPGSIHRSRYTARHRALPAGRHRRPSTLRNRLSPSTGSSGGARRGRLVAPRLLIIVLLGAALSLLPVLGLASTSWAYWTALLAGQGAAGTGTLTAPGDVTATVTAWRNVVTVSWAAAATSGPTPPAIGYSVTRTDTATGGSAPACATSPDTPTTSTSCTDSGVSDGTYRYVVTASYTSWTAASTSSGDVTVRTDTTAPTVTASTTPAPTSAGLYPSSPVLLTLTGQDPGGSGVASITYSLDGGPAALAPGDTTTVVVSGEGAHTVTYQASDNAGNTNETASTSLTIDSLRPAATVQQAPGQPDPTNQTPIVFQVAFTEPVTGFTAEDVQLSGAATDPGPLTTTVTGDAATYEVSVTGMTNDGDLILTIPQNMAHDAAGHGNTASSSDRTDATVTLDTTAPPVPSGPNLAASSDTGSSGTDRITQATELLLTGTAEPDSTITVYSDGTPVGTATTGSDGSYSTTTTALALGTHVLTAVATDAAGNSSPASSPTAVTIDTTAPTVVLQGTTYTASTGQVLVTGTGGTDTHDGPSVTLVVCAVNTFPCTPGDTLDTQLGHVDPSSGAWKAISKDLRTCTSDLEGVPICTGPGTAYLRATQVDVAGNTGATATTEATFP